MGRVFLPSECPKHVHHLEDDFRGTIAGGETKWIVFDGKSEAHGNASCPSSILTRTDSVRQQLKPVGKFGGISEKKLCTSF